MIIIILIIIIIIIIIIMIIIIVVLGSVSNTTTPLWMEFRVDFYTGMDDKYAKVQYHINERCFLNWSVLAYR